MPASVLEATNAARKSKQLDFATSLSKRLLFNCVYLFKQPVLTGATIPPDRKLKLKYYN